MAIARTSVIFGDGRPRSARSTFASAAAARGPRRPAAEPVAASRNASRLFMRPSPGRSRIRPRCYTRVTTRADLGPPVAGAQASARRRR